MSNTKRDLDNMRASVQRAVVVVASLVAAACWIFAAGMIAWRGWPL